ncbi:probable E3 ubiquitin-protein ligase HIP1 [Solanum tuberosum]|nr:PREDICTED: probable E3 ubiquitin-protein ligase HIP1 [Solanum tuberosum]XP_015169681.1 PREDICTED: probable E3 ubiquitin-protein ligase HIP1 [Solanum tuberosum]XP_015169682.1 PREDICTED: probable E3 ubiquitin-protein ligase HIP1 [Solanum tuberosum]XP_015169683.1 PREDICTED: probable E3 ubiquitin-protein ligase HIP1 [Solanum tuberosum]
MSHGNRIIDMEADQQGQEFFHSAPCMFYGSIATLPQPTVHAVVPAPVNAGNIYLHHVSDHQEGTLTYGLTQFNGIQHQHPASNPDLAISASSNHYNPYMAVPSASGDFPIPVNHGPHDRLHTSSHNILGMNSDYGRNNHYMDDVRGSFKRKNAEGIPANLQYHHALAGSSSSVAPMIARAHESDVSMDAASFTPPDYGGNSSSYIEDGALRSMSNRSGASGPENIARHNHNHLFQGNYISQTHQLPGNPWLDLQFNSNGSETQPWAWNQAAPLPYVPGGIGGCVDAGNMGLRGYHMTSSNGGLTSFLHPPIPQGHPGLHHLPPNIQGMRGQPITFPPQMTASSSHRHLPNNSSNITTNLMQGVVEAGPRYMPSLPNGFGLYRPHRRAIVLERNTRHQNLPNMRVLPEDGVAMLDVSGYNEVNNPIDQHRDMRLDVDHMSYEELLALGEQIGNVTTGLSDEIIVNRLKTRSFSPPVIPCTLETAACLDHEADFCVICQTDYNKQETIGTLDCGHEYHAECVKKWLVVKNTCPICKSTGLSVERKDL